MTTTATEPRGPSSSIELRARGWIAFLNQPIDGASLTAFRVLFGCLMMVAVARFFAHGWIDEYYLQPKVFFPYAGFEWVHPWPGKGMYLHFALMGLAAVGIALGRPYRLCAAMFFALFTYAHLIDRTNYLNHYYLISLLALLLALLPLHRNGGLQPRWVLWLLRGQVGCVYLFGGLAKLKPDWLLHAQPLKIWLSANSGMPVLGRAFALPWVAHAMSVGGALFDLCVVPALLIRRTRPYAYLAALAFHLITGVLFQLGMFPWVMSVAVLLFFPPDWPRVAARTLGMSRWMPAPSPLPSPRVLAGARHAMGPVLAAVYLAAQMLLPLRHWLHPGNLLWTEEGYRFSWNVMLMEKDGVAEFQVVEPSTGRHWAVKPRQYLTPYQTKMMAAQPDMVRSFARFLARDFEIRGVIRPQVHADVFASLNGRPRQRMIDPAVDLAREGTTADHWVLPLQEVPPP